MYSEVIILIPSYEPDKNLIDIVKELSTYNFKIVVVNDGSSVRCKYIFDEVMKYAVVINNEVNKGKGKALKSGLQYINQTYKDDYIVCTMDCDGQHKVKDAIKVINCAKNHYKSIILGKRDRKKMLLRSKFGSYIAGISYKSVTGIKLYDTQTGLRAFSSLLIPFMLSIKGNKYEYEFNVLLNFAKHNIDIIEIPIDTVYNKECYTSHFNIITDSLNIYKQIFKFSISSLLSFIIDYLLYIIIILISKGNILLSNVVARIISATINYNINKKHVFKSKEKGIIPIFKYTILAIGILTLNSIILMLLTKNVVTNIFIAKILTEVILFILSWSIQKKVVF